MHSHASGELEFLDDAFNLSVNYLMDSDYSLSPIPDVRLKKRPRTGRGTFNFAGGKTKMALWYVSHCNATSGRDRYVQELRKYNITVDIFGKLIIQHISYEYDTTNAVKSNIEVPPTHWQCN